MKILNVQEFIQDQYDNYRERRTSQFIRFLDKNVDFVTYYSINKTISTYSFENHEIDTYIGTDSPVRYNKINNMPVYGFSTITDDIGYDEELGGYNVENYSGEILIVPGVIDPCEGDCFILHTYNDKVYFQVTEVINVSLKAKPHFKVQFRFGTPSYLPQLEKQVDQVFNAIFDNIGTEDKVIISDDEFSQLDQYYKLYNEIMEYYIATYFKPKRTVFEIGVRTKCGVCCPKKYTDKFLMRFMETNRIILLDSLTKGSLLLDYNALYNTYDHIEYKKTIYWAIENKEMKHMIPAHFVELKMLNSPFTLLHGQTGEQYFTNTRFVIDEPEFNMFTFAYDFEEIVKRYKSKNFSIGNDEYSRILSIITMYLTNHMLNPGYFSDLLGVTAPMQEYIMLPIILFIIRAQIDGLLKRPSTANKQKGGFFR